MFVSIFKGKARGLGEEPQETVYMRVGVELRKHLRHFKGAKFAVFMAIALHADESGEAFPSYETLERETGYGSDTIGKALSDLCKLTIEGHRVLAKRRERDDEGQFVGGNRYLIFPTAEEVQLWESPDMDFPDVAKTRCGKIHVEEEPSVKKNQTNKEENDCAANDTQRASAQIAQSPAEQPVSPRPRNHQPSQQTVLFESQPMGGEQAQEAPKRPRKRDALWDAIQAAWKTGEADAMTGLIRQQLMGKIPLSNPKHESNFDVPATPDEVQAFAEWYSVRYPRCDMPTSPPKIQLHFYAFRREQAGKQQTGVDGFVFIPGLGYQQIAV